MSARIGFRVETERPLVSDEILAGFRELETVYVSDAMSKFGALSSDVRPVGEGMRAVGRALTVRTAPGDNFAAYLGTRYLQPGDILVIECRGQTAVAQWGDLASAVAQKAGAEGVVMDGATRDRTGMVRVGLPVFASPAFVANGSSRVGPGEINVPITVGGVAILPGDVVFGDEHGVVAVPATHAEAVLEQARKVAAQDAQKMQAAADGDSSVTGWLDGALKAAGYDA